MCIENMLGLSAAFTMARDYRYTPEIITSLALNLVRADMSHPSALRYLPPAFTGIVNEARAWLREAQEIIGGAPRQS